MKTKTEVDLSMLADDTKLAIVDDDFKLITAGQLREYTHHDADRPGRRVCLPSAVYNVPGFGSDGLRERMIDALDGENIDQAPDIIDSLPAAEFDAAQAALDALWEACVQAKKPAYWEETDTTVVFPGCVR